MPKGHHSSRRGPQKGAIYAPTIRKAQMRQRIMELVEAEIDPIVKAQLANAKGLDHFFLRDEKTKQFIKIDDPAKIEVALNCGDRDSYYWIHTKDPSTQAFTALLDRTIDRPTEHQEVSGPEGGPLVVQWQDD